MNRTEEMPASETEDSVSSPTTSKDLTATSFLNSLSNPASETEGSTRSSNPINLTSILLIILITLIVFSYFGLNLLTILGNSFQHLHEITAPFVKQFLAMVGYSAGEVINKSADVTADAAKLGIDVAEGTAQNIGDLFKKSATELDGSASSQKEKPTLEQKINTKSEPIKKPVEVKPDSSENPIQKPISSDKQNWCLIGEYQNKRGCVAVNDSDKCLSGQIFPSQQLCLNPTFTP